MDMLVMLIGIGLCATVKLGLVYMLFVIRLNYFGMFVCWLDVGLRYVVIIF